MKLHLKSLLLLMVLLVASACSTALESAGLSADDAALLSGALAVDLSTASADFDYSFVLDMTAEGENVNITTNGRSILDPANGSSLITMAGTLTTPDFGGEALPYDIELRTVNTNDVYIRGIASLMDPSGDPNQWLYLPADTTTQMALSQAPEVGGTGIVQDGEIDVAGIYSSVNDNFFGTASNYLTATRLDDMDGLAHFSLDLDAGEWLASTELSTGLQELAGTLAGDMIPADELEAQMAQASMMMGMASMVLSEGTYTLDYWVDSSGTLSRAMWNFALDIDPAMLGSEGEPVNVSLMLDVNFTPFGPDSVIVAPETFIDVMEMMGG